MKLIEDNKSEKSKLLDSILQNQMYNEIKNIKRYAALLDFDKTKPDTNKIINELYLDFKLY